MEKETISFRLDNDKKAALDAIAAERDRNRSYLLNEAVDAYLETYRWQVEHIRKGLEQANRGEFASEAEVRETFARLRAKHKQ